jgi:hypothetical protein
VRGNLPVRLSAPKGLAAGALIVVLVSLLNLVPFEIEYVGSPWPLALLWPVCGWAGHGVSIKIALILFALGLWLDILTGTALGTWVFIGLSTYGLTLLSARFLGMNGAGPMVNCAVSGATMVFVMALFALWQNKGIDLVGMIVPVLTAIALYFFVGNWFELSEDET